MTTGKSHIMWDIRKIFLQKGKNESRYEIKYLVGKKKKKLLDKPPKDIGSVMMVLCDKEYFICPRCGNYLIIDFLKTDEKYLLIFPGSSPHIRFKEPGYECIECGYTEERLIGDDEEE